jgi:hypothetical protein
LHLREFHSTYLGMMTMTDKEKALLDLLERTGGEVTAENESRLAGDIVDIWGEQNSADLDDQELMTAAIAIVEKLRLKLRGGDTLDAHLYPDITDTKQ